MLEWFALFMLVVSIGLVVYGVIGVYGIPYEIAKARDHPHQDAIGAATWVSLFTLGVLWPFLWIWAMLYRPDRGWGVSTASDTQSANSLRELAARVSTLEAKEKKVS